MDAGLVSYLKELDVIESNDSRLKKIFHVRMLNTIAKDWVIKLGLERGIVCLNTDLIRPSSVLLQGSTSLGVSFKNSDIDAVLVTPSFVQQEDFFGSFSELLRNTPTIEELLPIPDTFVPLIKMKIEDTYVDLILSRLNLPYVPCPLLFYEKPEVFYHNVDPHSVHGLSGLHLAQTFREIVPEFSLFTDLLKVIKTWASRRLINDYVYGFPASVAWAVLCAYICKNTGLKTSYTNTYVGLLDQSILLSECFDLESENSSENLENENSRKTSKRCADSSLTALVQIFFTYFSHWLWPSPVLLSPIVSVPNLRLYSWESSNESQDLMPIITPVFPHKNAAYTVRASSHCIVVRELRRAHNLVQKILRGDASWSDLLQPYDIRDEYRHFLKLDLTAETYQELVRLGGLIDSRLRDLASFIERNVFVKSVRICKVKDPISVSSEESNQFKFNRAWVLGMDIIPAPKDKNGNRPERDIDITPYLIQFYNILHERDVRTNFLHKLTTSYLYVSDLHSFEF